MISQISFLNTIQVIPVKLSIDFSKAINIRYNGYKKYGLSHEEIVDEYDNSKNATIFLASRISNLNDGSNVPLGTLRILDAWRGPVELEKYVQDPAALNRFERNFSEATRFAVTHCPERQAVKLALWKAFHRHCLGLQRNHMIVWVREGARRDYERLMFSKLPGLSFKHQQLGNKIHDIFYIELSGLEQRYRTINHPLHSPIFLEHHPLIKSFE
ncbi:MAG: hypothetical protein JWM59_3723 [Verrucomicrobiales bacterium]|nr:hypothetical protein [Verrucomicrobiales bacterium]